MTITKYDDIMEPKYNALDLAAMIGASNTIWSCNRWRRRLRKLGEMAFRLELYYLWDEMRVGFMPKDRAKTPIASSGFDL